MASIIIGAPAIWGETAPLLRIAEHLHDRGHDVAVIAGSRFADAVLDTGAEFVPLTGAADFDASALSVEFPERPLRQPGPPQLDFDMEHLFLAAMPVQHAVVQRLLAARPGSALIATATFLGGWPEALGAPGLRPSTSIAIGCNPVTLSTPQASVLGPVVDADGAVDEAATAELVAGLRAVLAPSTARLAALIEAYGGDTALLPPSVLDGFVTVPEHYLALTIREMDFGRTDLPASVEFGGPIPARAVSGTRAADEVEPVADDAPLVVVTQGTSANEDLGQLIGPTLTGLADAPVDVVAALGRPAPDLAAPANATVAEWVRFDEVLPRAAAYVTNGGWGGTQAALAAGVPVVVSGATEDKALVAARVRWAGVGIDLGPEPPTPDVLRDAVERVLSDPDIRAAAARMAAAYVGVDPLQRIDAMLAAQPAPAAR